MIRTVNLSKKFGDLNVLNNISIDFKPGNCSLIIGASGSGKTVLLKSIVGLHDPDEGEVWYNDTQYNKLDFKGKKEIRKEIGMLFQGGALFFFFFF